MPQPTPRPAGPAKRDWHEKIAAIAHEYARSALEEIPLFFIREPTLSHAAFLSKFAARRQVQLTLIAGVRPEVHGHVSLKAVPDGRKRRPQSLQSFVSAPNSSQTELQ